MDDHLQVEQGPFGQYETEEYEHALARALLPTQWRVLQMVVVPSFAPEEAVYVERADGSETRFRIVSARMKKHLWSELMRKLQARSPDPRSFSMAADAQRAALKEITPEVERVTAPISGKAVERLQALWRAALLDARQPPESRSRGTDGVDYYFADETKGIGYRTGKAWTPDEQSRTGALVGIGRRLAACAAAPAERRPALESDLIQRADALLKRF